MNPSSRTEDRSNLRRGTCKQGGIIEGDLQGSKDSGFAEQEHISTGHELTSYATFMSVSNSNDRTSICKNDCLRTEENQSKDNSEHSLKIIEQEITNVTKCEQSNIAGDMNEFEEQDFEEVDIMSGDKDIGFLENDNLSQGSSGSESYPKSALVSSVGYHNVAGHSSQTYQEFQLDLSENDDEALKEELMHIFEREKTAVEMYFKNKMEERLRVFRSKQLEYEETTRAEKIELEHNVSIEKMEMQNTFAKEVAKLAHTFNEERQQLEVYYKEQLKDLRENIEIEKKNMDEKLSKEKIEFKENLEAEYQAMVRKEVAHEKKEAVQERSELETRFYREKLELENCYTLKLTEAETSLQKLKAEFEANLAEERMRMEKQRQDNIREIDAKLKEESQLRHDKEKELEQQKEIYANEDSFNKKENERLRNDIDALRREVDDKNRENMQLKSMEEKLKLRGSEGMEGKLRDDFERLLSEHKLELDKSYEKEKQRLDETLQSERRQIKEENDKEKEKIKAEQEEIRITREKLQADEKSYPEREQLYRPENESVMYSLGGYRASGHGQHDRKTKPSSVSQWAVPSGIVEIGLAHGTLYSEKQRQNLDVSTLDEEPFGDHPLESTSGAKDFVSPYKLSTDFGHPYKGSPSPQQQREPCGQYSLGDSSSNGFLKEYLTGKSQYHITFDYHEKTGLPKTQPSERKPETEVNYQLGSGASSRPRAVSEERELIAELRALKSENEGLKAKMAALEENIELHKKYKKEAKAEMERLLKENEEKDLKIQYLTQEIKKMTEKKASEVKADIQYDGSGLKLHTRHDGETLAHTETREMQGRLKGLEVHAVRADKRAKEYDVSITDTEKQSKEKRKKNDLQDEWNSSSRQEVKINIT